MTLQPACMDAEHVRPVPHGSRRNGSLLTARDVAELLGVPVSWVYERSRSGRIPTVTLGRYRREAIEAWVRELEGEVGQPR